MEGRVGGKKEFNTGRSFSYCDDESVISDESASPKSIDSEYSYDTTESSLEDELATVNCDDCVASITSGRSTLSRQCSIVDGLLTVQGLQTVIMSPSALRLQFTAVRLSSMKELKDGRGHN